MDRELSLTALVTLAEALERLPADKVPRAKRAKFKQLTRALWLMIEVKSMTPVVDHGFRALFLSENMVYS